MLIFDFNRDIKPALTVTIFDENIHRDDHGQDFGLLSLHYQFVMLHSEIGWHDLQIRQVSGNFADCAMKFANWPDWTEHIYLKYGQAR